MLLELRQVGDARARRLVVRDTEDLVLSNEDGGEVGVGRHDDALVRTHVRTAHELDQTSDLPCIGNLLAGRQVDEYKLLNEKLPGCCNDVHNHHAR